MKRISIFPGDDEYDDYNPGGGTGGGGVGSGGMGGGGTGGSGDMGPEGEDPGGTGEPGAVDPAADPTGDPEWGNFTTPTGDGGMGTGDVPPGPVPEPTDDGEAPLPEVPPPTNTATGLPTFGLGSRVTAGYRTPNVFLNREVGPDAENNAFMMGFHNRFGPGTPVAPPSIPGFAATPGSSAVTDEELLRRSILRR